LGKDLLVEMLLAIASMLSNSNEKIVLTIFLQLFSDVSLDTFFAFRFAFATTTMMGFIEWNDRSRMLVSFFFLLFLSFSLSFSFFMFLPRALSLSLQAK
jgi:hypothetical protein